MPILISISGQEYAEMSEIERRARLMQLMAIDGETGVESCSICHITYQGKYPSVRQRSLMNHIERVHLRIKAYPCQFCDRRFHSKAQRSSHITVKHREEHHKVKGFDNPPRTRLPPLTGHHSGGGHMLAITEEHSATDDASESKLQVEKYQDDPDQIK